MRLVVFCLLAIFYFSCKKSVDTTSSKEVEDIPSIPMSQPVKTRIYAYLSDEQNQSIDFSIRTPTFYFENTPFVFNSPYLLTSVLNGDAFQTKVLVDGWNGTNDFDTYKTTTLTASAVNYIHYKTVSANYVTDLSNVAQNNVTLPNNIQMGVPAQSLYISDPGIYPLPSGARLFARFYDPTDDGVFVKLPAYYGGDNAGKRYFLKSYGTLLLRATTGNAIIYSVDLYPGKTATLKIAIPQNLLSAAPDSLSSWTLGANGLWQPGAKALKKGNSYELTIGSFGYIMLAQPQKGAYVNLQVQSALGAPVVNSTVRIKDQNSVVFEGQTDADGHLLGFVPTGQALTLEIPPSPLYSTNNYVLFSKSIGPFSANTDVAVSLGVDVKELVSLKGTATTCGGQPIAEGLLTATILNHKTLIPIKNGQYRAAIQTSADNHLLRLRVLDLADNREGTDTAMGVTNDKEYTTSLNNCPFDPKLYATYSIDGVSNTITGDVDHPYDADLAARPYQQETTISCVANNKGFEFSVWATGTGTYTTVNSLFVNGQVCFFDPGRPATITFTRYDIASVGFVLGSIDLYYKDNSSVSHHLVGNFKVKR